MKQLVCCFLFVIPIDCFFYETVNYDNTICWENQVKLGWEDFQGLPDTVFTNVDVPALAVAATTVKTKVKVVDGTVEVDVKAMFNKTSSWVADTTDWQLLVHEQLHFDLSELYARKIRKEVDSLKRSGNVDLESYKKLIRKLRKELEVKNALYDNETGNGSVDFMQERWIISVNEELKELDQYGSKKENCQSSL